MKITRVIKLVYCLSHSYHELMLFEILAMLGFFFDGHVDGYPCHLYFLPCVALH